MKTDCQKEQGKQKSVAEEEEEDQSCDKRRDLESVKRDLERACTNGQEWQKIAYTYIAHFQ